MKIHPQTIKIRLYFILFVKKSQYLSPFFFCHVACRNRHYAQCRIKQKFHSTESVFGTNHKPPPKCRLEILQTAFLTQITIQESSQ